MRHPLLYRVALAATLAVSVGLAGLGLWRWFTFDPAAGLGVRLPGRDGRPEAPAAREPAVDLAGVFQTFDGVAASLTGAWPRFRGADFDSICKNGVRLANSWGQDGPPTRWSLDMLGEGHAAPVVLDGRVYVIDYDEATRSDAVRCLSLEDGREIWRRSYKVRVKRNHGMSRTIPAVSESLLVTMGPRCHVVCLDPKSGDFRWGIDLVREYGTTEPLWYTGQCPLIDGDHVILAACGTDTLMMAMDGLSGNVAWTVPNPDHLEMSHSSIMPMVVAGVRTYVYCALGAVVGVAAEGERLGQELWRVPWNARVVAPSPVQIDGERILLTAGYGVGGMMVRVQNNGGAFSAEVLYAKGPKEGMACEQQTPIQWKGLLYGIMPKDAGTLREQFACYHPDGHLVWSSGPENRFGLGPFLLADNKFYVLSDDGVLTMIEASAEAFIPLDRARVLRGQDAWGPIAVAGSRMLLRDSRRMTCIDVGASQEDASR
ncbi:MAG TPA: PQQ-binding-like beta-propeller repeat protein [Candidatus Hydrogenedentes bacterium]|nr:PQQ-binding-like beta-propeller repeat protein [Candidatus Hydrogenedentota bacterium]HPG66439.1 PQQ-binding-like beta-propeller repeat protein [Candidatus Hydrogenedentota bacterium]